MHLCRLIISQRSVMGWSQCYCAVGLNRNTFSFTADPRTAVNEDLSQIFPISPHQTGTHASCLCPWGSFILALLEEKMWLYVAPHEKLHARTTKSSHLWFGYSLSASALLLVFFLQKSTSLRVTESLFKERRLLHFNYCFYCRVQ